MNEPYDLQVEQEYIKVRLTDLIATALQETGTHRATLAKRMGVSRAHITQTLSGERNMTIDTAVKLLWHLGYRLDINYEPL